MINIGVCDDDIVFSQHIKSEIENYFSNTADSICLHVFTSAEQFLSSQPERFDLLFLDIYMPEQSGLELASCIKSNINSKQPAIIFVSSLSNYVFEAIHYAPLRFIRKELLHEELAEALTAFLRLPVATNNHSAQIKLTERGNFFLVNIDEIYYLEINRHYLDFHCLNDDYHVRGRLSDYESLLCMHNFCRINQSCLVNLNLIKMVSADSVVLSNGKTLFISRGCKSSFRSSYLKFERGLTHVLTI